MRSRFGAADCDSARVWAELEFHLNISTYGNRRNLLVRKGTYLHEPAVRIETATGVLRSRQLG